MTRGTKVTFVLCAALLAAQASPTPAKAQPVAPVLLSPGGTVSPLPNGFSTGDG